MTTETEKVPSCFNCMKPLKRWTPPEGRGIPSIPAWVYDCECSKKKFSEAYRQDLAADLKELHKARFDKLELGPAEFIHPSVTLPEDTNWADPLAAARNGEKVVFTGVAGSGKTDQLKLICKFLCEKGAKLKGGYVPAILNKFKRRDTDIGVYQDEILAGDVLVLDDLDKLRGSQFEVEQLLYLVDRFDTYNKPILVTLGMDLFQFRVRLDELKVNTAYIDSIISRLEKKATLLEMDPVNHRARLKM